MRSAAENVQIKIFDQEITIFSPGKLYGDVTIEKLKTDTYQSRARNKLVAEAFYLTKDIEKYGSGYIRVREEIKSYPTMRFDYEESGDGYLVTLGCSQQKTVTTPKTRDRLLELITSPRPGVHRAELSLNADLRSLPLLTLFCSQSVSVRVCLWLIPSQRCRWPLFLKC